MEYLPSETEINTNESAFRQLFTDLQFSIIKKRVRDEPLDTNEKTYYYKFIKPRMNAIRALSGDLLISGQESMIPERIMDAQSILKRTASEHKGKDILITGSFLFSKDYDDIDIFIFTKYHKDDYRTGKVHVNFLQDRNTLFFSSISQICISNFQTRGMIECGIPLKELLLDYELLTHHLINREEHKNEFRTFLLKSEYVGKRVILNPKQLHDLRKIANKPNILHIISAMLIDSIIIAYPSMTIVKEIKQSLEEYGSLSNQYPSAKNIIEYIRTYSRLIELAG